MDPQRWTGTVERVRDGRPFGFLRVDDGPDGPRRSVYLDGRQLPRGVKLENGLRVSFVVIEQDKGLAARAVRLADPRDQAWRDVTEQQRYQVAAALRFRGGLRALLEAHRIVWSERLRVVVTTRPGAVLITEADVDAGERPVLAIGLDDREPSSFGCPMEELP